MRVGDQDIAAAPGVERRHRGKILLHQHDAGVRGSRRIEVAPADRKDDVLRAGPLQRCKPVPPATGVSRNLAVEAIGDLCRREPLVSEAAA